MTETRAGVLAMVAACVVWGLSPLYYKLLAHIPPIEVLAHRTFWSAVIFSGVLLAQGRFGQLRTALGSGRSIATVAFAALAISTNWFFFIWSIGAGHATEASLGYFLFPLVAVLIGRLAFGESMVGLQGAAILIAGAAVALLTIGLGVAPWIALILAGSFGIYGLVKKRLDVGPVVSVTGEVVILAPIALVVFWLRYKAGEAAFGANMGDTALLIFSGALTATPLILFSFAAKRVAMATVGLIQYLNPTLQFFCAVIIFGEPFGLWHAIAFPMIWIALALYSLASWRQEKARTRPSSSVVRSSTT
ncbi:MAG: EamA family transporter RarD [Rhodobacteraceae bacterium]|nr:EamA family transporter RarD [Paracoccaceae bacterium]MCW9041952.1 EamA family transporter RarD [Pseudopelagicola sp.]